MVFFTFQNPLLVHSCISSHIFDSEIEMYCGLKYFIAFRNYWLKIYLRFISTTSSWRRMRNRTVWRRQEFCTCKLENFETDSVRVSALQSFPRMIYFQKLIWTHFRHFDLFQRTFKSIMAICKALVSNFKNPLLAVVLLETDWFATFCEADKVSVSVWMVG